MKLARNTLTLGTLAIVASFSMLLLAARSSLDVQLAALGATLALGLLALRRRSSARGDAVPAARFADTEPVPLEGRRQPLRQKRLALVGNEMLARTRRQKQPLTVAVFDFGDLPELQAVLAGEVARDLGPIIARKLKGIARRKAVVVRTGATTFTVLLPTLDGTRARHAIAAQFGKACCVEFAIGDDEMLLVPDFLVQTVRADTRSVEEVYRMLRTDLVKGKLRQERRQAYLRDERESHSRRGPSLPLMAATMPAPFGLR